jgi:hypothetical protein
VEDRTTDFSSSEMQRNVPMKRVKERKTKQRKSDRVADNI